MSCDGQESFEDVDVADILNQYFIAVKVDREERPDIDAVYMNVCQAMTGQGGWPLTVLMTPQQEPFFAGTYFPKNSHAGMPGLIEILDQTNRLWRTEKDELIQAGNEIVRALSQTETAPAGEISKELPARAVQMLKTALILKTAGFGGAPKFPSPHNLIFCLNTPKRNTARSLYRWRKNAGADVPRRNFRPYRRRVFPVFDRCFWLVPHLKKCSTTMPCFPTLTRERMR